MSTSPINPPPLNVAGLASGLDTTSIVQQLMAAESQPRNQLATQQTLVQATRSILQGFQAQLQSVSSALDALHSPTLFTQTQQADSSDPTRVLAASASGAGVGGYQVAVSQLANSAQRTYSFTSPASAGTITIDGHDTTIAAGASIQDLVTAINSDSNATVYAAATDSGTLVLSNRATGDTGTGFIALTDGTGSLTEQTSKAKQGKDALFTVDGVAGSSHSNTVTNAIAGVTLTLKGVTTTSGPVTVTVGAPGADPNAIQSALQSFVSVYNSTVDAIRAKLTEQSVPNATATSDREKGLLFNDRDLSDLLDQMRQAIYTPIAGLPDGMNSLADLGITTGDPSSTVSQDSLDGKLTLDTKKLATALQTNPGAVRDLLLGTTGATSTPGWARSFQGIVDAAANPGGTLDVRISGESSEIKDLTSSIADWNQRLALRQQTLQQQFTAMETALSQSQSQAQWLSGQLAQLG
jgi:flagellar hook-associated protein 2